MILRQLLNMLIDQIPPGQRQPAVVPVRALFIDESMGTVYEMVRELRKHFDVTFRQIFSTGDMSVYLTAQTWDIVFLDYALGTGLDSIRQIRALDDPPPIILISGTATEADAVAALREGAQDFIVKGHWSRLMPAVAREMLEHITRQRKRGAEADLILAYDQTIAGWARALDLKDRETEGHSQRVAALTVEVAKAMQVPDDQIIHIWRGALLHDIGKIAIPDRILLKNGALNQDEWELMKRHPQIGCDLLSPISYLSRALAIPCYHHERFDGQGYPNGLASDDIPLAARIFIVVDSFDAMINDRPYRKGLLFNESIKRIWDGLGTQFDPDVVKAFVSLMVEKEMEREEKAKKG